MPCATPTCPAVMTSPKRTRHAWALPAPALLHSASQRASLLASKFLLAQLAMGASAGNERLPAGAKQGISPGLPSLACTCFQSFFLPSFSRSKTASRRWSGRLAQREFPTCTFCNASTRCTSSVLPDPTSGDIFCFVQLHGMGGNLSRGVLRGCDSSAISSVLALGSASPWDGDASSTFPHVLQGPTVGPHRSATSIRSWPPNLTRPSLTGAAKGFKSWCSAPRWPGSHPSSAHHIYQRSTLGADAKPDPSTVLTWAITMWTLPPYLHPACARLCTCLPRLSEMYVPHQGALRRPTEQLTQSWLRF